MPDPLRDASRRVQRAWSADGLSEVSVGLLFLAPALIELAKFSVNHNAVFWRVLNSIQMLIIFPGVWIVIWGLPRLRNRLLGSREGIMIPRLAPEGIPKAVVAMIVATMTAFVLVAMLSRTHWISLTVLGTGLGTFIILLQIGLSTGLRRFSLMSAAVAAASVAIAVAATDFETSFVAQFGFIGFLLAVSGGVNLAKFLHAPPKVAQ